MKWLETKPDDYERGIAILTLGRIHQIYAHINSTYIHPDMRILEIGCGTGSLAVMMAENGATVTGVDASPAMLAEAEKKIVAHNLQTLVSLKFMDVALIGDRFPDASFDLIVSTLVFSELDSDLQHYVLKACQKLLVPEGRLLIADEVEPSPTLAGLLFRFLRFPLVLLTWLLTRTTTKALTNFQALARQNGLNIHEVDSYLCGSFVLYEIQPSRQTTEPESPPIVIGRLHSQFTLRAVLLDLWLLFFRLIPPYPKFKTGVYAIGSPTPVSPVLVTGNFDLSVRRLVKAIDGQVDAWVLVADSAGINVWCASGGGYFTAEKVIAAVKSFRLEEVVNHRTLIMPQLCANGVDGWRIREEIGWRVLWGPVKAGDIPAYLNVKCIKTDPMRQVYFPLKDRLEMVTVALGFYGLLVLLPVFIISKQSFFPITLSLVGFSYFYAVVHPWLPGRDGLYKSVPLALIALAGLFIYTIVWHPLPAISIFHWSVGLIGLSVFIGAELQGMSPLMRGEQANWGWEVIIALLLIIIYWLVPKALGWG